MHMDNSRLEAAQCVAQQQDPVSFPITPIG
jgi:hypothetical protein